MAAGLVKISQLPCVSKRLKVATERVGNTEREKLVKHVWRHADAVCFDVDSTVCQVTEDGKSIFTIFRNVGQQLFLG